MEMCLVTGCSSESTFCSAESIVSVKREKLPTLQGFMNQWHFSASPSDVTVEMPPHESRCESLNASLDPFHSLCGARRSHHMDSFSCAVSVENNQPAGKPRAPALLVFPDALSQT